MQVAFPGIPLPLAFNSGSIIITQLSCPACAISTHAHVIGTYVIAPITTCRHPHVVLNNSKASFGKTTLVVYLGGSLVGNCQQLSTVLSQVRLQKVRMSVLSVPHLAIEHLEGVAYCYHIQKLASI